MDLALFYDYHYESYLQSLNEGITYFEGFEQIYREIDEKLEEADLYGKTVMVSEKQFPKIYNIISQLCDHLQLERVPAFVYEDFYYGVEAKGLNFKHIEISAKTILDFTEEELIFLIASELFTIKLDAIKYKIIIDETIKSMDGFGGALLGEALQDTYKISAFQYLRALTYTCDNYGYSVVKDVNVAFQAIVKMILNNRILAEQLNIKEYIKQAEKISALTDEVNIFTKMDEKVPYGPYRIKNILAFAITVSRNETIKKEMNWRSNLC